MKPALIYKTYHPEHKPKYYGEQIFLDRLFGGLLEEVESFEGLDGAVVMVRANDNIKYIDQLNADLAKLKWCLVIVTGNEYSSDFHINIKHENCRIWVQTPKPSDVADFFVGFGFPSDVTTFLPNGFDPAKADRPYDWSFAGQVTHNRRRECLKYAEKVPNGKAVKTEGFNQGLSYPEYIKLLTETKIVPCPGGAVTPDTFRVYEALECGCIPVLDDAAGHIFHGRGQESYWQKVLSPAPLWVVSDWSKFPEIAAQLIGNFEEEQQKVIEWWGEYKSKIITTLRLHLHELQS